MKKYLLYVILAFSINHLDEWQKPGFMEKKGIFPGLIIKFAYSQMSFCLKYTYVCNIYSTSTL